MERSAVGWIVSDVGRGLWGVSATLETTTATTYGVTSAGVCDAFWMKIADEDGPSGIVASSYQKRYSRAELQLPVVFSTPCLPTRQRSVLSRPHTPSAHTHLQERILKVVELGRVRSPLHRTTSH